MKKTFLLFFFVVIILSCKKENSEPLIEPTLPFENDHIKVVVASTVLPSHETSDIHFFDSVNGVGITIDGQIYKTANGGQSWTHVFNTSPRSVYFSDLLFVDNNTGYVFGSESWTVESDTAPSGIMIYKTNDGGSTWTKIYERDDDVFYRFASANGTDLYMTIYDYRSQVSTSNIYKSTDGGMNWNSYSHVNFQSDKILFNNGYGYITGTNYNGKSILVRSTDNGISWNDSTILGSSSIGEIAFANNTGYYITGSYDVYRTKDNGENWSWSYGTNSYNTSMYFNKLTVLSDNSCLIWSYVNKNGNYDDINNPIVLTQTFDGGNSWTDIYIYGERITKGNSFYTSTNGYVLTNSPSMLGVTIK